MNIERKKISTQRQIQMTRLRSDELRRGKRQKAGCKVKYLSSEWTLVREKYMINKMSSVSNLAKDFIFKASERTQKYNIWQ
jgi:hypothetical protein